MKNGNQIATSVNNFPTTAVILGSLLLVGGYVVYLLLKGKPANITPIIPNTAPGCKATDGEFPLKNGSGYTTSPNYLCERVYVKNVQTVLNKFLANDNKDSNGNVIFSRLIPVDGKFGVSTENAITKYYGGTPIVSKILYERMMSYFA